jgi:hypothetical protein
VIVEDHEFVDHDGATVPLSVRQARKLRGYRKSNPQHEIAIIHRDDDGLVLFSVLPRMKDGEFVDGATGELSPTGSMSWRVRP